SPFASAAACRLQEYWTGHACFRRDVPFLLCRLHWDFASLSALLPSHLGGFSIGRFLLDLDSPNAIPVLANRRKSGESRQGGGTLDCFPGAPLRRGGDFCICHAGG